MLLYLLVDGPRLIEGSGRMGAVVGLLGSVGELGADDGVADDADADAAAKVEA